MNLQLFLVMLSSSVLDCFGGKMAISRFIFCLESLMDKAKLGLSNVMTLYCVVV